MDGAIAAEFDAVARDVGGLQALAMGTHDDLFRACDDRGLKTGCYCEGLDGIPCFAAVHVPRSAAMVNVHHSVRAVMAFSRLVIFAVEFTCAHHRLKSETMIMVMGYAAMEPAREGQCSVHFSVPLWSSKSFGSSLAVLLGGRFCVRIR